MPPPLSGHPVLAEVIGMKKKQSRQAKRPPMTPGGAEQPVPSDIYPVLDTDLARDNLENDLSSADLQSL